MTHYEVERVYEMGHRLHCTAIEIPLDIVFLLVSSTLVFEISGSFNTALKCNDGVFVFFK